MRHFLTIFAGLALGRLVSRAIDHKDWEVVIIGLIIASVLGIFTYLLSKHDIK